MLLDLHGTPLPPSWLPAYETRVEALVDLRSQRAEAMCEHLETSKYYCDWPLVTHLCLSGLEQAADSAALHGSLGIALLRQGDEYGAAECATRASLLDPWDINTRQLQWELREWEPTYRHLPDLPLELRKSERLRLEPLGPHHWNDLLWQYDDPAIAHLCRLPQFTDYDHWRTWLREEYAQGDLLMFAVMENTWGFCGMVSLIMHRGIGFVYYWLGRDFRGQGLASEAVHRLLSMAHELWGMHCCYATVLKTNEPSRCVLSRLGFALEPIAPVWPHDNECIYRLGPVQSERDTHEELALLLIDMKSGLRLPPRVLI